jgi:DNA end-binding protein Ku
VSSKEVELAKRLVDDMTEHWKPAEFKDTYHEDLMRRIHEKIKSGETKEITKREAEEGDEPRSAQIIDLAALLKQSLDRGSTRRKPADARRSRTETAKPALRVVAASRGSSRSAAKRKRA